MTPDQIIAAIASTAAALSAVATLLTVREIAKQRQASYRAELVFEGRLFRVAAPLSETTAQVTIWDNSDGIDGTRSSGFDLRLLNIGLGAAKAVTLTWDFDIDKSVVLANKLAQSAFIGEVIGHDNGLVSVRNRNSSAITSNWIAQRIEQIDYILPAESAQRVTTVRLPHAYLMLVSKILLNSLALNDPNLANIPTLRSKVQYGDIGEKSFTVEYDIIMEISTVQTRNKTDDIDQSTTVTGSIRIERVEKSPFAVELAKEASLISASMVFPGLERTILSALNLIKPGKK